MAKKSKARERLFTVFFMFAVTFVSISLVSLVYLGTRAAVSRNEKLFLQRAVMEAAGRLPDPEPTPGEVLAWYQTSVQAIPDDEAPERFVIRGPDSPRPQAHVLVRVGNGLWGKITGLVGLSPDLRTLTGVTFVKQNETPGLGARIEEPWFKEQFRNKTGPFKLVPEGTHSSSASEMDAITGATITSTAVRDMLNKALREAPELVGTDGLTQASATRRRDVKDDT